MTHERQMIILGVDVSIISVETIEGPNLPCTISMIFDIITVLRAFMKKVGKTYFG
jgi:hypothetical protein